MDKATEAADYGGAQAVSVEKPPIIIVFSAEQQEALQGTLLEGSRGISLLERGGILVAEQLA
jgi:hypothetical protein